MPPVRWQRQPNKIRSQVDPLLLVAVVEVVAFAEGQVEQDRQDRPSTGNRGCGGGTHAGASSNNLQRCSARPFALCPASRTLTCTLWRAVSVKGSQARNRSSPPEAALWHASQQRTSLKPHHDLAGSVLPPLDLCLASGTKCAVPHSHRAVPSPRDLLAGPARRTIAIHQSVLTPSLQSAPAIAPLEPVSPANGLPGSTLHPALYYSCHSLRIAIRCAILSGQSRPIVCVCKHCLSTLPVYRAASKHSISPDTPLSFSSFTQNHLSP